MRHLKQKSASFGRHRGPRKALIRGLVYSLVEKERIKTTLSKAKCVRPLIEKAVTMGKRGDPHSRRVLLSRYPNKKAVDKILKNLSPRFKDRLGGYTRIIKLGFRSGDQAPVAYLEFVDFGPQAEGREGRAKAIDTVARGKGDTGEATKKSADKKPADKKSTDKKSVDKKTTGKKSEAKAKTPQDKKQKKLTMVRADKKRKKARRKQQTSRRKNRS